MAISALPVIAKTLMDLDLYRTDLGMVVVSAAIFNDLIGWTVFTSTSALVLLAHLGATEVHAYGVDWTPDDTHERSAERFRTERETWEAVVAWMESKGVKVERINSNPTPRKKHGQRRNHD